MCVSKYIYTAMYACMHAIYILFMYVRQLKPDNLFTLEFRCISAGLNRKKLGVKKEKDTAKTTPWTTRLFTGNSRWKKCWEKHLAYNEWHQSVPVWFFKEWVRMCMYVCVHINESVHICLCMTVCLCIWMCVSNYTYTCMWVSIVLFYIPSYVWIPVWVNTCMWHDCL